MSYCLKTYVLNRSLHAFSNVLKTFAVLLSDPESCCFVVLPGAHSHDRNILQKDKRGEICVCFSGDYCNDAITFEEKKESKKVWEDYSTHN